MKSQCPSGSNALIGRNIGTDSYIYICRHFDTRDLFAKNHCWTIECNDKRKKKGERGGERDEKRKRKKKICVQVKPNLSPFVKRVFIFLRELANIPPASLDETNRLISNNSL